MPDGRLPASVEVAAYYVVSEALTNVAKYAAATRGHRPRVLEDDPLVVAIADDGCGGADPRPAAACAGSPTASRRCAARSGSRARPAAVRRS